MKHYLTLFFHSALQGHPVLQEWRVREGSVLQEGDTLFTYQEGDQVKEFKSAVPGTFKVFFWKERQTLEAGCEIGVLSVPKTNAERIEEKGLGKIIEPEELKSGMTYAEAASIRLPK